jgi:hypothetical protein
VVYWTIRQNIPEIFLKMKARNPEAILFKKNRQETYYITTCYQGILDSELSSQSNYINWNYIPLIPRGYLHLWREVSEKKLSFCVQALFEVSCSNTFFTPKKILNKRTLMDKYFHYFTTREFLAGQAWYFISGVIISMWTLQKVISR